MIFNLVPCFCTCICLFVDYLRYGKFFVLDFQDIIEDMWDAVTGKFNQVQQDLLPSIMNKDFIKDQRYNYYYNYSCTCIEYALTKTSVNK